MLVSTEKLRYIIRAINGAVRSEFPEARVVSGVTVDNELWCDVYYEGKLVQQFTQPYRHATDVMEAAEEIIIFLAGYTNPQWVPEDVVI